MPTRQKAIRLFQFSGITVYLHWSWFLIAIFEINGRNSSYTSFYWNVLEYLALFVIVMLHEFGHALACRQTGGTANQIVLWPLGGVAYVDPPPRPGAVLWSIVAGPLVNVVLAPLLYAVAFLGKSTGWWLLFPNLHELLRAVFWIDLVLLGFNILPIYPLDGGKILWSLLWFVLGRARSLMVATLLGFVGVAGFVLLAIYIRSVWFGILAGYLLINCWGGLQHARALVKMAKLPRRHEFGCPRCQQSPPAGEYWKCGKCGQAFDTFATNAACPYCSTQFPVTRCLDCGGLSPMSEWAAQRYAVAMPSQS
ncbi:MAG TPA: M50 family metallopeptidase [Terriglobales bacterium]|nr:M50 family metallopeptidase [Terriglobales bacterium]